MPRQVDLRTAVAWRSARTWALLQPRLWSLRSSIAGFYAGARSSRRPNSASNSVRRSLRRQPAECGVGGEGENRTAARVCYGNRDPSTLRRTRVEHEWLVEG